MPVLSVKWMVSPAESDIVAAGFGRADTPFARAMLATCFAGAFPAEAEASQDGLDPDATADERVQRCLDVADRRIADIHAAGAAAASAVGLELSSIGGPEGDGPLPRLRVLLEDGESAEVARLESAGCVVVCLASAP